MDRYATFKMYHSHWKLEQNLSNSVTVNFSDILGPSVLLTCICTCTHYLGNCKVQFDTQ